MSKQSKLWMEQMTLPEKAAILSGKNVWETREIKRLGIPSITLSDGPHGIRKQNTAGDHLGIQESMKATCFPTAATMANSWDEQLAEEVGEALGQEARHQGVDILLGPGMNIKRNPLCGRNFEYFSEDPYLTGKMAGGYIRGIQSMGIYACPKHFAVNSQEDDRMSMDAIVDERALQEIYLSAFEMAICDAKAKSLMTSYNKVNGIYSNENPYLLKKVLRREWNFKGMVVTDWGGSCDHVKGVKMRSNLEMPAAGLASARELLEALKDHRLSRRELDIAVLDLLNAIDELSQKKPMDVDIKAHHCLARRAAAQSAVLLKNEGKVLPLKKGQSVALIGDFAFSPRYQGAGSSLVRPTKLENSVDCAKHFGLNVVGVASGYERNGLPNVKKMFDAMWLAKRADVIIYYMGLTESSETEGLDRKHMKIPRNQLDVLAALQKMNQNIVVVLSGGSVVEMDWQKHCRAIVHGYLSGQAGASAMMEVLTGRVNPSGHLAESYPMKYEDVSIFDRESHKNVQYRESIYVGYRYYEKRNIQLSFPFGFGLSYTEFLYRNLQVDDKGIHFFIKNVGKFDGATVAQMYIGLAKSKVFRAKKELKGFTKVFLKRGEEKQVDICFDQYSFRFWNEKIKKWDVEPGEYEIFVGESCEDIWLKGKIVKKNVHWQGKSQEEILPHYYSGNIPKVTKKEFLKLLHRVSKKEQWNADLSVDDTVGQLYYAKSKLARGIYRYLVRKKNRRQMMGSLDLNLLFVYHMPFRSLAKMSGGRMSMEMVCALLQMVNGHLFVGLWEFLVATLNNRIQNQRYQRYLDKK